MRHKSAVPWFVAAVCIGPFALALLLFYGPWDLPMLAGSRTLLEPPVATPAGWLAAPADVPTTWFLIYARTTPCEPQCARDLERLRQVHLALNRDAERLQTVYLHTGEWPPPRGDDGAGVAPLLARRLDEAPGTSVARSLDAQDLRVGRIYVADPRGSLIASYPRDVEQKELLRDLKRLLAGA